MTQHARILVKQVQKQNIYVKLYYNNNSKTLDDVIFQRRPFYVINRIHEDIIIIRPNIRKLLEKRMYFHKEIFPRNRVTSSYLEEQ